jgi:hypothetical protein
MQETPLKCSVRDIVPSVVAITCRSTCSETTQRASAEGRGWQRASALREAPGGASGRRQLTLRDEHTGGWRGRRNGSHGRMQCGCAWDPQRPRVSCGNCKRGFNTLFSLSAFLNDIQLILGALKRLISGFNHFAFWTNILYHFIPFYTIFLML